MDLDAYVTADELRTITNLIDTLTSEYGTDVPLAFDVRPVDVNGEVLGFIKRVDGEYRWFPNGEEE